MSFEKELKKIDHRDWEELKNKWMGYLPSFNPTGRVPPIELPEFHGLEEIARKTGGASGHYNEDVKNLRTEIFSEGVYLFHKASNVCSSGLSNLDNGIISWSASSAYHSCFFSLKALLCFLGLSFPRIKSISKCLMIDCFPEEILSKNKKSKGIVAYPELKFVLFPNLTHQQFWEIMKRTLRVTTVSFWDNATIEYILSFDSSDFAFQRNSIHYKNNFWLIAEELFTRQTDDNFAVRDNLKEKLNEINQETLDFSFIVSYLFLSLSHSLFKDIASRAPILKEEFDLANSLILSENNYRMLKSIDF